MKNVSLLIKPASGDCNLDCQYCFYKDELAAQKSPAGPVRMTAEIAEQLITGALQAAEHSCTFAFQGGEPTLAGLAFYRAFTETVQKHAPSNLRIQYVIQTNGLLLDDAWLQFLYKQHFLVGLSLDGPKAIHDKYRKGYTGEGSFFPALRTLQNLQKAGIEYNILTVLTKDCAAHIDKVYQFYKKQGVLYQQYIPCLEPLQSVRGTAQYSLTPEDYAQSIKRLFDLWLLDYTKGDYVYIRQFENWAGILKGHPPEACAQSGSCAMQNIVEADGNIYACDFYVADRYLCGNVKDYDWNQGNAAIPMTSAKAPKNCEEQSPAFFFLTESRSIRQTSQAQCASCRHINLCRGGCRRDYYEETPSHWKNYYCNAYQEIFDYITAKLIRLL